MCSTIHFLALAGSFASLVRAQAPQNADQNKFEGRGHGSRFHAPLYRWRQRDASDFRGKLNVVLAFFRPLSPVVEQGNDGVPGWYRQIRRIRNQGFWCQYG